MVRAVVQEKVCEVFALGASHFHYSSSVNTSEVVKTRGDPSKITPVASPVPASGKEFDYAFAPFTVTLPGLDLGG